MSFKTTLGHVVSSSGGEIQTGPFGSQLHKSDYSELGCPVVMPKDIVDWRISESGIARTGNSHVERLARHKLRPGDIVYGRRGEIGRQALVRTRESGWICGTGCLRIRLGEGLLDPAYLHFYLRQDDVIDWIGNQAIGATMPNLNTSILGRVPLDLPPFPAQLKIASILSAFDDLIENNTRRIQILEEMARRLYREWFVHFRFPGHENVKMVDSGTELGMVPEGWDVVEVAEAFTVVGGGTPSKQETDYWSDGDINWFVPSDLTRAGAMFMDESEKKINCLGLEKSSARMFPAGSVMLTSRATIGVVAINTTEACTNQGFITCLPNNRFPAVFLYQWLVDNSDTFQRLASGATFKEISKSVFRRIPIVRPPMQISSLYQQVTAPILDQVIVLQRMTGVLRRLRDLLLPRLVSGQIDVSELDIPVEEDDS